MEYVTGFYTSPSGDLYRFSAPTAYYKDADAVKEALNKLYATLQLG